jgi:hypothetical protein
MHALGRRSVILGVLSAASSLAAAARAEVVYFTESAAARGFVYSNLEGMFGGTGQYGCGVALCDLDNDGDDDLIATGGSPSMVLYANNGAGYFTNVTSTAGLGAPTKPSGLVCADYDGDGDLDIFLTRWLQPAILYRNNGGLNFTNVTSAAGITGTSGAGAGSSFGDFDGDGDLDLAIAMRTLTLSNMLRNRFFRNEGNGTFTEISAQLGVDDAGASFQCLLQDLDRDGDCDLYVSNDKGTPSFPNRYFRNEGGVFVSEPNNGACIAIDSMGVFAGDIDMNGYVDIYCANTGDGHALLLTDTARIYTESADMAGMAGNATGWGTVIFDPDNDGDQDAFIVSMLDKPDYLFLNEGGFPFNDRSSSVGLGDGIDTYCIAVSDIDRDGDLDILTQPYLATLDLFVNTAPAANNAIRLKVLGRGKNTHAVGALVDVEFTAAATKGGTETRTVLREVMAGSSYKSQSSYIVHAGIGTATTADRITVRWPRVGASRPERVLVGYAAGVEWPIALPESLGDFNRDGKWNGVDAIAADACAGTKTGFGPSCALFDFDGDADVDGEDLAQFRARLCDIDRDGMVGASDLSLLLAGWGAESPDLTGDDIVGAADLAILLDAW